MKAITLKWQRGAGAGDAWLKPCTSEVLVEAFIMVRGHGLSLSPQVTVPCTTGEAGGTMPVPTPTSMVCGTMVATTATATRTVSTGLSFEAGLTLSRRRPC